MSRTGRVARTSWVRTTRAPGHAEIAVAASAPSTRSVGGRPRVSPTKSSRDSATSTGQAVAASSSSRRSARVNGGCSYRSHAWGRGGPRQHTMAHPVFARGAIRNGHDGEVTGKHCPRPERQRHCISLAWHDHRVLHLLWYGLLAVVLAAGLFGLAARFLPAGEQIAPPLRDEPPWELPLERVLQPEDVDAVRLPVALRGYRFAETDLLLDRLATELRSRDAEIARLRGDEPSAAPSHENPAAPPWAVTAAPTAWPVPPPWAMPAGPAGAPPVVPPWAAPAAASAAAGQDGGPAWSAQGAPPTGPVQGGPAWGAAAARPAGPVQGGPAWGAPAAPPAGPLSGGPAWASSAQSAPAGPNPWAPPAEAEPAGAEASAPAAEKLSRRERRRRSRAVVAEPPVVELPVAEPPADEPASAEPAVVERPLAEPPVAEPPVAEPPAEEPPAREARPPEPEAEPVVLDAGSSAPAVEATAAEGVARRGRRRRRGIVGSEPVVDEPAAEDVEPSQPEPQPEPEPEPFPQVIEDALSEPAPGSDTGGSAPRRQRRRRGVTVPPPAVESSGGDERP
ncbi:MAG: hypothetical protein QOG01_2694 [Pseudonocardiales bacterium]|nr:hypothetical protein [Pseudonocardiales bacterium]